MKVTLILSMFLFSFLSVSQTNAASTGEQKITIIFEGEEPMCIINVTPEIFERYRALAETLGGTVAQGCKEPSQSDEQKIQKFCKWVSSVGNPGYYKYCLEYARKAKKRGKTNSDLLQCISEAVPAGLDYSAAYLYFQDCIN